MGRLSDQEITNIILAKGFKPIDISCYQNKMSKIICQCDQGHSFSSSLHDIEKSTFKCPACIGAQFKTAAINGQVPEKNGYRIVAFDQSSNNIGVSIYDNGNLVYYDWYKLTGELDERLAKWYNLINTTVVNDWKPDYVMLEDIQYQKDAGVVTFKTLAEVLGVACAALEENKIPHDKVLNKTWQAQFNIAGSNRVAQKRNVVERVKEYFGINVTDDVGDAILIGRYAANKLYEHWSVGVSF